MKRLFALTLALLLLLTGCGAKSESAAAPAATMAMTESVAEEALYDEAAAETGSSTTLPENQKLIRTVYMDAETQSMTDLLAWMDGRVASLGGYYEQKSVYRRGSRDDGSYYHSGDFMIRIPAENLDQFVSMVGDQANVTSTSESTENVTLTYVSTQSRVEALEVEQDRLLELLENAENMEDLLTIEERLTDVRWELENYASQLRVLDNQVNYSTIHLSVWEVDEPTVIVERTVWQKIGDGFTKNTGKMWNGLVNTFVWILTAIPYLIPMALIGGIVLLGIRFGKKLGNKKKTGKTEKTEQ